MAKTPKPVQDVFHPGYSATRPDGRADRAGWCRPKPPRDKKERKGKAPDGPAVLFGPDDTLVAQFDGETVRVHRFDTLDGDAAPVLEVEHGLSVASATVGTEPGARVLYAVTTKGQVWVLDFTPHHKCPEVEGLAAAPRVRQLANRFDGRVDHIVALRRHLVLQVRHTDRSGFQAHLLDLATDRTTSLGDFALDRDLTALDARRHDILLAREKGEQRMILFGEASSTGQPMVQDLGLPRVTAATILDGTYLVVAQKGGAVSKVDLRTSLPANAARAADPFARACYVLKTLLKRCGCDCGCDDGHGSGGRDPNGHGGSADPGDDPCDDGGTGRPGGDPTDPGGFPGGHVDDEPCGDRQRGRLNFTPRALYKVGSHIVAVSDGAKRMAVLDTRMNVMFERKISRRGATVLAGQPQSQNLLIAQARTGQIEAWKMADFVGGLEPRLPDGFTLVPTPPMESVTYWGQKNPRANPNPHLNICLFPVIEPGQTYSDPDMGKLLAQVQPKIFDVVNDYYIKNSFGELTVGFTIFGDSIGGTRKPLVLPQKVADYWWDGFRGGGLKAVMPADWANPIVFDGTEALEIQANPRAGAVKTFDLPFAALWSEGMFAGYPVALDFDGTETLELTVETQTGATHVLPLSFPAATLTLNANDDHGAFLDALATHFTNVIRAAEATLPGSPQLIEDVVFRRSRDNSDDTEFGRLIGQFRVTSSGGSATQKGRISITSPGPGPGNLSDMGLGSIGVPGVMTSSGRVDSYFGRVLRSALSDAGQGPADADPYFGMDVTSDEDAGAQTIDVDIVLTTDYGGEQATIERLSSSGLSGTGWESSQPNQGSETNPSDSHALRYGAQLADDTFTAACDHIRATGPWSRGAAENLFSNFDVMMIAHVGAPPSGIPAADQWGADDPDNFGSKRMYARTHFAQDQNPPGNETPVQMGTDRIIGQRFNAFASSAMTNQAGVMAHEIGHAIDLPDLYSDTGYRDDVQYIDDWGMMAGGNGNFHHFCGWSKWAMGWIPEDSDPELNRVIDVEMPDPTGVSTTDAWLVPIEYWDGSMDADVRAEVGGNTPIGQLMKLHLGSDGGVLNFLELRDIGTTFSQNLSPTPSVIATNGLDPNTDRAWAVNGLYRRSLHLLNAGNELQNIGDTWDFASNAEFPVAGCRVEIVDIRTVRGSIPVYRLRVEREQADYIDLHFQDHAPSWKSPDIWVDWADDNPDPATPRTYPVGMPTDQGEIVRVPSSGTERHWVVARVHNAGTATAEDVKVRWYVCDPPGSGDDGRWVNRGTETIESVAPGDNELAAFAWDVDSSTNDHQCMRMEIIDWSIPSSVDPATGDTVALASDDVVLQNNNAQQNVFDFEALTGSPYEPITFRMQVHNDRVRDETAALVPNGLPYGSKLTISPREWRIPPGEARVFNCTLQLDENIIRPGCNNDSGFLLTAWRRGGEADANWGSCFYHVRPRWKTRLELTQGYWVHGTIGLNGLLHVETEDPLDLSEDMPLVARIRLLFEDTDTGQTFHRWRTVQIQGDGSFSLSAQEDDGAILKAQAWFDRRDRLGSSVSNELQVKQQFIG